MAFYVALSLLLFSTSSFGQNKSDTTERFQLESYGDSDLINDSAVATVHAKFTVEANGKVSNIVILKNICVTCTKKEKKETNNLVKELILKNPIPPRKDSRGNPKRTTYVQPFIFRLREI